MVTPGGMEERLKLTKPLNTSSYEGTPTKAPFPTRISTLLFPPLLFALKPSRPLVEDKTSVMVVGVEVGVGVGVGSKEEAGVPVPSVVAEMEASCEEVAVGVGEGVEEVLCFEPKMKAAPPITKRANITRIPRRVLLICAGESGEGLEASGSEAGMTCSSSTPDIIDKCLSQVKFGIRYK